MDLLSHFTQGSLPQGLIELFISCMDDAFSPIEKINPLRLKVHADESITKPIGQFLSGADDPDIVFQRLKEKNLPKLCGYILKYNDPVYTCLDCTADPTSVMCNNCFNNSEHKNHNYKVLLSAGNGGYCDCGDHEAFKRFYYCSLHDPKRIRSENASSGSLPAGLNEKFSTLCDVLLEFTIDCIFLEIQQVSTTQFPTFKHGAFIKHISQFNEYSAVLYNDEIHSYQQVISALTSSLQISEQDASVLATVIDSEGRSVLKIGDKDAMQSLCATVKNIILRQSGSEIGCFAIRCSVLAYQNLIFCLLEWIMKIMESSDDLQAIFCQRLLKPLNDSFDENTTDVNSVIYFLLAHTDSLWKHARQILVEVFIKSMLMVPSYKLEFAVVYLKSLPKLFEKYCNDKHHTEDSVMQLSVQIFTSQSLAMTLICNHGALEIILDIILQVTFEPFLKHDQITKRKILKWTGNTRSPFSVWNKSMQLLKKLEYLLHNDFEDLSSDFLRALIKAFPKFLDMLAYFQDTDNHCRCTTGHISSENEWEAPFIYFFSLMHVNHMMADYLSRDVETFRSCIKMILATINSHPPICIAYDSNSFNTLSVNDVTMECKRLKQLMSGAVRVSYHQPLTRFLGLLIEGHVIHDKNIPYLHNDLVPYLFNQSFEFAWLTSLRLIVWNAQIENGLWKRNGTALVQSSLQYSQNQHVMNGMLKPDIRLVQMAAANLNQDQFIFRMLDAFELSEWVTNGQKRGDSSKSYYNKDSERVMVEEFLKLLIIVVTDRIAPGIGDRVTSIDMIKNDLIQHLIVEPLTHSRLVKFAENIKKLQFHAGSQLPTNTQIDDTIKEVAEFKKSKGLFYLKEPFYERFNPFYVRLTRNDVSKAVQNMKTNQKNSGRPIMLPPCTIALSEPFSQIKYLIASDLMIRVINKILQSINQEDGNWSDTQIERILYLINVGLDDDQFCHAAEVGYSSFFEKINSGQNGKLKDVLLGLYQSKLEHQSITSLLTHTISRLDKETTEYLSQSDINASESLVLQDKQRQKALQRYKIMEKIQNMQKRFSDQHSSLLCQNTESNDNGDNYKTDQPCSESLFDGKSNHVGYLTNCTYTCILCQETQNVSQISSSPMILPAFIQRSATLSMSRGTLRSEDWPGIFLEAELLEGPYFYSCGHSLHLSCLKNVISVSSMNISKSFHCPLCQCFCNSYVLIVPPIRSQSDQVEEGNAKKIELPQLLSEINEVLTLRSFETAKQTSTINIENEVLKIVPNRYTAALSYEWLDKEQVRSSLQQFTTTCNNVGLGLDIREHFGLPNPIKCSKTSILALSISYTMLALEAKKRFLGVKISNVLPERSFQGLHALVRIAAILPPSNALALTFENLNLILKPLNPKLLRVDLFHTLVTLCLYLPHSLSGQLAPPICDYFKWQILQAVAAAHAIQVFLSLNANENCLYSDLPPEGSLQILVNGWRQAAGLLLVRLPEEVLQNEITNAFLPFLRCAFLFFRALSDSKLEEPDWCYKDSISEFKWLNSVLKLPDDFFKLIEGFDFNPGTVGLEVTSIPVLYPRPIQRLIKLPIQFTELLLSSKKYVCKSLNDSIGIQPKILQLAKCLICGETVCCNSICCQVAISKTHSIGGANMHALKCTGGNGLFLCIPECTVLIILVANQIGCFRRAPYTDEYGETDEYLKRGKPLNLDIENYEQLEKDWISQMLPIIVRNESLKSPVSESIRWNLL